MKEAELRALILETLGDVAPELDVSTIDGATDLRNDLDLDSMDFLNFVIGLSARSRVEIAEADYPELVTVDGCVAFLAARLPAAGP